MSLLLNDDLPGLLQADAAENSLSIVAPAYNEAPVIRDFHRRLADVMTQIGCAWEVIYVNDGSTDATLSVLTEMSSVDPHITLINLSRNFGKEVASTAGLDHANGAAIVLIDADLQDPPELISELVAVWQSGYDVAYATRRSRSGETWLKKATARAFYRVMRRFGPVTLPPDTGDFRLMSRRVVEAVKQLREHHRFMKGMFAWVGFPSKSVFYDREPRLHGTTKWSYWALFELAIEGITSFTLVPLKFASFIGILTALFAALYAVFILLYTFVRGVQAPGYPSLMVAVLFLGGVQLITLGVIGEYLGRIFTETKTRPLYFIEQLKPSQSLAQVRRPG